MSAALEHGHAVLPVPSVPAAPAATTTGGRLPAITDSPRPACPPTASHGFWARIRAWAAPLLVGTLVVLIGCLQLHRQLPLEINSDEGINAMKAWMLAHGHPLYRAVWDDQPPLYTYLLRWCMGSCGWAMLSGRLLTLAFAGLAAGCAYDAVRLSSGHRAALAGALLLITAPFFLTLSMAIMIGLPAISLAVVSLAVGAFVAWRQASGTPLGGSCFLVLSGLALLASLMIKLFTGVVLIPLLVWWWMESSGDKTGKDRQLAPAWMLWSWGFIGGLLLLVVDGMVPLHAVGQMIAPHLASETSTQAAMSLGDYLALDLPLTLSASLGLTVVARRGPWPWRVVGVWWLLALVVIIRHRPLWWHHTLLASVPAALLGAQGIAWLIQPRQGALWRRALPLSLAVALLAWTVPQFWHQPGLQRPEWRQRDQLVLDHLRQQADQDGPVVSDRCLFPFLSGREMPADLVVATWARIQAGRPRAPRTFPSPESPARANPVAVILTDRWQTPEVPSLR